MEMVKTIKIPIAEEITNRKLNIINRISSRVTYGVMLYLEKIREEDITKLSDANKYQREIKEKTGLPSAFIQCARDRALWMYKSYKKLHREWEKRVKKLEEKLAKNPNNKKLQRKLYRLKEREPSTPRVNKKQPIFFDIRIGKIDFSRNSKKFKAWAKISTLHKGERIDIPLQTYPYAEKYLKGWDIKSFQVIYNYRLKRWEVHVVVKKEKDIKIKIKNVAGIDLGIKRPAVISKVGEDNRVILIMKDEKWKPHYLKLKRLNNRIAKLQRIEKIKALKKLKNKRRNLLQDIRRKMAGEIAKEFKDRDTYVFIGYPKWIRENNEKGNGKRKLRKMIHRWAFKEFGEMILQKVREYGGDGKLIGEKWTTHRCPVCGSKKVTVEDRYRYFKCKECGLEADRDVVGSANILLKGLKNLCHVRQMPRMAGAVVTRPEVWMMGLKAEEVPEHTTSLQGGCPPF